MSEKGTPRDWALILPHMNRFNHDAVDKTLNRTAELLIQQADCIDDLLAACKEAQEEFDREGYPADHDIWKILMPAIAKAEGEVI